MADLSTTLASAPDTLLSPSAARNLASTAKDWAYVTNWLAEKYAPNPVPAFEQNDETLRVLLAFAECNRVADGREQEKRAACGEALQLLVDAEEQGQDKSRMETGAMPPKGDRADLFDAIETGVEKFGHEHGSGSGSGNYQQEGSLLDEIANTAVVLGGRLGVEGASQQSSSHGPGNRGGATDLFTSIGSAIVDLSREEDICNATIRDMNTLHRYIDSELTTDNQKVPMLEVLETASNTAVTPERTTRWMREIRGLRKQIEAYDVKLKNLEWCDKQKKSFFNEDSGGRSPTIEDIMAMEQKAKEMKDRLCTGITREGSANAMNRGGITDDGGQKMRISPWTPLLS